MTDITSNYLHIYGPALHKLGYKIVPIAAKSKAPRLPNWQHAAADEEKISIWCQNHTGCGILSEQTVGIDIDCRDEALTVHMIDYARRKFGYTPHRIGMPPKALLPYRCTAPFSKMKSTIFHSDNGQKHQLEILGAGQQFVAAHIHPDTGKPYLWHYTNGTTVETLTVPYDELPIIAEEDAHALIAVFEFNCKKRGWQTESRHPRLDRHPANSHRRYTDQQVRNMLAHLDPSMPYDNWLKVGMALKSGGFPVTFWDNWSRKSPKYEEGICDKKWSSFCDEGQA